MSIKKIGFKLLSKQTIKLNIPILIIYVFQFEIPQSMPLEDVLAELRSLQDKMGFYMSQEAR